MLQRFRILSYRVSSHANLLDDHCLGHWRWQKLSTYQCQYSTVTSQATRYATSGVLDIDQDYMRRAFLVGDLPFGSYETSGEQATRSAVRMMKEGLMDAVKLEGATSQPHTCMSL